MKFDQVIVCPKKEIPNKLLSFQIKSNKLLYSYFLMNLSKTNFSQGGERERERERKIKKAETKRKRQRQRVGHMQGMGSSTCK